MANKRRKSKRKSNKIYVELPVLFLIVCAAGAFVILWYLGIIKFPTDSQKSPTTTSTITDTTTTSLTTSKSNPINDVEGVMYDDFQIHFMALGNDKAGDSVYIKAGETDILIDAGSRSGSSKTTIPYMQNYVTDNKLEYIIVTHGDQDHIEAFPNILETFDADIIIRNQYSKKESNAGFKNMIAAFENQVNTNGAKQYFASDCFDNKNGAKRTYQLSDKVTMDIIYNYYYWNTASDENNYSVCTLFTYTDNDESNYFLLTGDLEEAGENKLVSYYDGSTPEKTLPKVALFKAGHHGSKTSSNESLLNLIQPQLCVVSCCCGTTEYTGVTDNQFPTQDFIDRIAVWTDKVYVTSVCDTFTIEKAIDNGKGESNVKGVEIGGEYIKSSGFKDLNGNVIISCSGNLVGIACTNNLTKLKDTDWFNQEITIDGVTRKMRIWPE